MANGPTDNLIGTLEEEEEMQANDLMLGGLGLGGAAFAAQAGRAPASVPMGGQLSPLAQQVAANDVARQAAARQAAASNALNPFKPNLPTNTASPAVGPRGSAALPKQPSLSQAQTAARASASRAAPSLLGRAGSLLRDPRVAAFGGGFTLGSVLDNAFDISGNIARGLIPDAPTLTREERAELGQADDAMIGTGRVSGLSPRSFEPSDVQATRGDTQTVGFNFPVSIQEGTGAGRGSGGSLQFEPILETVSPVGNDAVSDLTAPTVTMDSLGDLSSIPGSDLSMIPSQEQFAADVETVQQQGGIAAPAPASTGPREVQDLDPQGRLRTFVELPDGTRQLASQYKAFEKEAAARGARLDARPDFMEAQRTAQPRGERRYTDAQLRNFTGGGDALKVAKEMDASGFDPIQKKSYAEIDAAEQAVEAAQAGTAAGLVTEELRQEKARLDIEALRKKGLPDDVTVETDPSGLVLLYRNGEFFNAYRPQSSQLTDEQLTQIIGQKNPYGTAQSTPTKGTTVEGDAKPKKGDIVTQGDRRYKFDGKNYELLD